MAKEIMEGLIKTDKGIVKIVGHDGATFVPHISDDYVLSWTNDKGLENPEPVKLPISKGEISIGDAEPMEPNILIWIDTGNVSVKYRDPQTGTFAEVQSGGSTDDGSVKKHNESETAHNDIRLLLADLSERLNAIADSDDTTLDQLSEIVAYIKANKTLIESVTTSKVNVADIVDNLTTNVSDQPLSAKMGVELRRLISTVENSANNAMSQASSAQSMASSAMNHASSAEEIASSAMQRASSAEQMASAAQTEIEKLKENGVPGGGAGTSVNEVHIGADEPTDGEKLWIDPNGEGDGLTSEDVKNALGYTPANAKTVDELSEVIADLPTKEEIVADVLVAIGTPLAGAVDENNVITLGGELADGTYTLKYYNQGEYIEIGTLIISGGVAETEPDTTIIWELGTKIDSATGAETTGNASYSASNYIEIVDGYTYTIAKNISGLAGGLKVCYYDTDKNFMSTSADVIAQTSETVSAVVPLVDGAKFFRLRLYAEPSRVSDEHYTLTATKA